MDIREPGYGYIFSPTNGNGFKGISNNAMQCVRALYIHTSIVSEGHGIRACISFSERILAETDILNMLPSIPSFHLNQLKRRILCLIYCVLFKNNPSPGVWVTFFTVILVARPFPTTLLGHICTLFPTGVPSPSLQYQSVIIVDDEPESSLKSGN